MFSSAFSFLVSTILSLLTMMFLLRFLMQLFKASFNNPIGQIVIALTDFAVKPARKFIPSWKKNDLSTLFLALVTQFILQLLLLWMRGFPFAVAGSFIWPNIFAMALLGTLRGIIDLFFYAVILQAILSWVNSHSPIAPVLSVITRPILDPIRRLISVLNGIDFSPLVALILLQMASISIMSWMQKILMAIL